MYYELYVDVLFLVNFVMDYILLLIVRRMLKCSATHINILFGAMIGAGLTCVVTILPIPYAAIKFVLFYLLVNTLMIVVGLKIKQIRIFVKAMILLYIGAFLMGGIMGYVRQYIKVGSLFFGVAILGYYVVLGIWNYIAYLQRMHSYTCEVQLYFQEQELRVKGLIDTGNNLYDPVTSAPVCILEKKVTEGVLKKTEETVFRYIPYHSIGKTEGVLPIIKIEKMCVKRKEEEWFESPLIAISEEEISKSGEYQMILNPNLF